jgi:3-oxo-5-alpha-steroid 4-dehydrogenase 1
MQDWPLFTTALTLPFFNRFLIGMIVAGAVVFFALCFINAGYGQYIDRRWGKAISNRVGWVIMELPVVVLFFLYWVASERTFSPTPLVFFLLFNLHYCQRTFVFPLLIRGDDLMPLSIILFGMAFNTANAYMQGAWIFHLSPADLYTPEWLTTPQFVVGVIVFLAGFVVNLHSDRIIRRLRGPGDIAFHIPRGGMFERVSCANYLGELVEWIGWAILTFSWSGLVFALWTFANLVPRARRNHTWYIEQFGDEYPHGRKRLIPFVY